MRALKEEPMFYLFGFFIVIPLFCIPIVVFITLYLIDNK